MSISRRDREMADVQMPKSVPCKFDNNWAGLCGKPSDNGWCSKHEELKCSSCGEKAVRACDAGASLICGAPLCATCTHAPRDGGHVTRAVADEYYRREHNELLAKLASRGSPVQRMDESLGVPLNLFELRKGNLSEWPIKECFQLELSHGLMGFFPAIVKTDGRMVFMTDKSLIMRVWSMLSPRKSALASGHAYVSESRGLLYVLTGEEFSAQERSTPQKFINEAEFLELTRDGANPFRWAPGLIGTDMSQEEFRETIEATAKEYGVEIPASAG